MFSKTLKEGSQIKKLIFSYDDFYSIDNPKINISFSVNTLTIDCSKINEYVDHLSYLKFLFKLLPGLILRLKGFENWGDETLDWIWRLLIYCEGSPPYCKLSFSKVVIHIDIDKIKRIEQFKDLYKLKHLYHSLSKIYDLELENITYEDLFINGSYFKKIIERQRDEYNNEKLKFERSLKYRCIECYTDGLLSSINDGFNQTIEELKLKEFQFYKSKIKLRRYD